MIKLFKTIVKKVIDFFNLCCEDMADGIATNNWRQVVLNILCIILLGLGCGICGCVLLYLIIRFWFIFIGIWLLSCLYQAAKEKDNAAAQETTTTSNEVDMELARQRGAELQSAALALMFRVLVAVSSFTPIIRPYDERSIEIRSTKGESFYMDGEVVIYQAEAEVEGEVTPDVEDTIQRELQRYAVKYAPDYPMLVSPEAGGRAPVEVLAVKNLGNRVVIDFVFTTAKSIPMIEARRRARIERQQRQERPTRYIDDDYSE